MKTIIIAEAGVNHNGNLAIAKKMVKVAKEAGADFIKFQSFKTDNLVTKNASMAKYQIKNTSKNLKTQYQMLKKLEINKNFHLSLINECNKKKIKFLSTPFDLESIDLLKKLKLKYFKIPSGEINNLLYLKKIGEMNKIIFLSTGMSNIKEISKAISILIKSGTNKKNIYVMHCNTAYPTPYEDINLNAINTIKSKFKIKTGLSDHSLGIEVPIAAVALGSSIIEKHFTLSRNYKGPDHQASLEPNELKDMITKIRNVEKSLGNGLKNITNSEKDNIKIARKSIVAKINIQKGDLFSEHNLTIKRPGTGISPMNWYKLLGKRAKKNYSADEIIKL